jgi:hypothetical protein
MGLSRQNPYRGLMVDKPAPSLIDLAKAAWPILRNDGRVHLAVLVAVVLILLQVFGFADVSGFIHRYQAIIGTIATGTLGFFTVNKTLRTNAEHALKLKEQEIAHEREGVRVTLLSELTVLHRDLKTVVAVHDQMEEKNTFIIREHFGRAAEDFSIVYRATLSRIGLLSQKQLVAVVRAYSSYDGFRTAATWLYKEQTGNREKYSMQKMNLPYEVYKKHLETTITGIETAILRLGGDPTFDPTSPKADH